MTQPSRIDLTFPSRNTHCAAWLYAPTNSSLCSADGAPCVVMAHGLGGVRHAGLEPYAERFAAAGLAVLLFDYRHFGDSPGEPRQHVSVSKQLDDWRAAIGFARAQPEIDASRIGIWGSSFSGGHVIALGAEDSNIAAVCSQGAMMDGLGALKHLTKSQGVLHSAKLTRLALRDRAQQALGLSPVTQPVVGEPGSPGIITTPGSKAGYLAIAPDDWPNTVTTTFALTLALYRPGLKAGKVSAPILFVVAEQDSVVPPSDVHAAAERAGDNATVLNLPCGHFEIYVGDWFEQGCSAQTDFLTAALAVK